MRAMLDRGEGFSSRHGDRRNTPRVDTFSTTATDRGSMPVAASRADGRVGHMDDAAAGDPEIAEQPETTTAVIHGVVPMSEIADFFDRAFSELATLLDEQGVAPSGPAFARYAGAPGDTADLEVGFPVGASVSPQGGMVPSALPAGRVARLIHAGSYDQLGDSWGSLGAWIAEQGLTPSGDMWEIYVTEPSPDMDPGDLRTELFWLLE